jgi:DNA-binding NarL/FixJ family response regulator
LIKAAMALVQGEPYLCPGIMEIVLKSIREGRIAEKSSALDILSDREQEVLRMVAAGKSNKHIADALFISPKTVEKHKTNLKKKLNLTTHESVAAFCLTAGLIAGPRALSSSGHGAFRSASA